MTRTTTDWGALVMAELRGHEVPGTTARLLAEATGRKVTADDADFGVTVKALQRLADSMRVPADVKKLIGDLDRTAQATKAAAESAKAEQAKLAKARQDLDDERAAQAAVIARELKEHQAAMAAAHAELASVKKQAAELKMRRKPPQ